MLATAKPTAYSLRGSPMSRLAVTQGRIPTMTSEAIEKVAAMEKLSLQLPQVDIETSHILHGGMYARSIMIPAGVMLTGALIKIATILIVSGDVIAYIGDETIELTGYNVLPASANRKQAFVAKTDVYMTMIFASNALSVAQSEEQFTDDANRLLSRQMNNKVTITGEL